MLANMSIGKQGNFRNSLKFAPCPPAVGRPGIRREPLGGGAARGVTIMSRTGEQGLVDCRIGGGVGRNDGIAIPDIAWNPDEQPSTAR